MIKLVILDIILNYCRANASIAFCADKINECLDRKIWEYNDISPKVYPDDVLMMFFIDGCKDEAKYLL